MRRPRTFIGLRVDSGLHRVGARLAALEEDLRPTHARDLHITLHFLGETPDEDLHRVARALAPIAARTPPLELAYQGLGAFPEPARARAVWCGVSEVVGTEGRLATLATEVGEALEELGYPREARKFRPHVTLGRLRKRPAPALVEALEADPERVFATEIVSELVHILSDPRQRPYHYTDLTTLRLGAPTGRSS